MNMPDFVRTLVDAGIEVTISKNEKLGYFFDLNTQSKSHMHLYDNSAGQWRVSMRYDEDYEVEDIDDIKRLAIKSLCGRNYMNEAWLKFLDIRL